MKKPILLLLLVCSLFFAKVIFAPPHQVLSNDKGDIQKQFFAWRTYGYTALKEGNLPLWTKDIYCGVPYLASTQSAIFYPLNAVFLITNTTRAINWSFFIHIIIAGIGIIIFLNEFKLSPASKIVGAITFALSAPLICHIAAGHLTNINTLAWIGFVFWAIYRLFKEQKLIYSLFLAIFLCMQFLAGHIQYCYYTWLALLFFSCFLFLTLVKKEKKPALTFLFGIAIGLLFAVGLSAVQLIPSYELSALSIREKTTYTYCSANSLSPENLIMFLMPDFFGNSFQFPYWGRHLFHEMCGYTGIVALCLTFLAFLRSRGDENRPYTIFFGIAAMVSLILAFGSHSPLFPLLYKYAPGFNLFRGNAKFLFLTSFAIAILASFGTEKFISLSRDDKKTVRIFLITASAISTILLILFFIARCDNYNYWKKIIIYITQLQPHYTAPEYLRNPLFVIQSFNLSLFECLRAVFLILCFCAIFFIKNNKWKGIILVLLVALDMISFGSKYLMTFDSRTCAPGKEIVKFLKSDPEPNRIALPVRTEKFQENSGLITGIESLEGHEAVFPKSFADFIGFSQRKLFEIFKRPITTVMSYNKFTNLLNVKYVVVPKEAQFKFNPDNFEEVYGGSDFKVFRALNALKRIFFVNDIKVMSHNNVLYAIERNDLDVSKTAIIEEPPPFTLPETKEANASIDIISYKPDRIVLEADVKTPGLLVISDTYYPGWKATVNGIKEKIYRTDYFLRGVFLKKGKSSVELEYRPASLYTGALISLISLIALMIAGFLFAKNVSSEGTK